MIYIVKIVFTCYCLVQVCRLKYMEKDVSELLLISFVFREVIDI